MFQSFFMGGFECATHRRRDGKQLDVLTSTGHAERAAQDYTLLAEAGIRTVRDGMRWHLIEAGAAGDYDWSSLRPMLRAARETGTQVIWDLCHWGVPEGLDVFSEEFVERFAAFAGAAARVVREEKGGEGSPVPLYCPINEMSFWAWVGGDVKAFAPHEEGRGPELKRQLVRAALRATEAVRAVDPRARFVQAEPLIDIVPHWIEKDEVPGLIEQVAGASEAQFEAWEMMRGRWSPELGGSDPALDVLGVNYYWNNQWVHGHERKPLGHRDHKPLHVMLRELWERFGRPIVITETGAEDGAGVGWLGYVCAEVRQAQREGVEILGVCLYPVMDYPGWDDERHCHCGLIATDDAWQERSLRQPLVEELKVQACMMR